MRHIKLGNLANFNMGQSPIASSVSNTEGGIPFLQGNAEFGSITPKYRLFCTRPIKLCKSGDILISVRAPVGALNKADHIYCIGRGLAAISFVEALPNFGWHLLNYWVNDLRIVAQGSTFEAISKTDLENLWVMCPSDRDQYYIAQILDTLDTQIQETERLIAKLKQVRDGLLHDLLTKGINENGEVRDPVAHPEAFKESRLGMIPKEWTIKRLEDCYTEPARNGLYKPAKYYGKGNLMIHMPQMFRGLVVDPSDAVRVEITRAEMERFKLKADDLVFARRSLNLEGAGRCSLIPGLTEPTTFESSIIRVRLRKEQLRPAFVNYFLNSDIGFQQRLPLIRQVAVSGVSSEDIASMHVPCPSVEEQDTIIRTSQAHDLLITAEETYLSKLQQIKKGLLHDLLTGTVHVASLVTTGEQ